VPRVLVVGGGITGLAAAVSLADAGADVVLREAGGTLGGKIRTSPFAGLPAVDEGADAFLRRVPDAMALAMRVGLADALVSPTGAHAAVWHRRLHQLPDGVLLGVPGELAPMARTGLLSWRGKARAAIEPLLPRTPTDTDSIGAYVRARFGHEVHERLVDALVGSIYAADTDRSSFAAVPQLAELASSSRSLLLGARRARAAAPASTGPVFAAPAAGMASLVDACAAALQAAGADVHLASPVTAVERDGTAWRVDGERVDAVVLTAPAAATAPLLTAVASDASRLMSQVEHVDVLLVTLAVPAAPWPDRLRGLSGYLVPKPDQRFVTAASFGSQKWAHWRPADGSHVLRVSLGRDGLAVGHLDDEQAAHAAVQETSGHLGVDLQPTAVRVSRWTAAFPQYRPHHASRVRAIEAALPDGIVVAGASYDGIGIPSCIRQANAAVRRLTALHEAVR
jgi:oxygen-dependent protoporphyrinogen oxidase